MDFDDDDEFEVAALLVADLNGDGKADLIIPQGVYLGRGDGDFRWGGSLWCGAPMALAGNGDGRHELYCARSREPDRIARWRSDGDGKFRYLQDVSLEAAAGGLLAGDFDQDGVGELAVSLPARKELQLFDAPEAVALELTGRFAVGGEPTLLAAADWNGDGASDLAAASAKNASLWLLPQSWSSGAQPGILRLGSAAEEIGELSSREQEHGERERVRAHDPFELRDARAEALPDRRQRDVHDGVVEHDHEETERDGREREPLPVVLCEDPSPHVPGE